PIKAPKKKDARGRPLPPGKQAQTSAYPGSKLGKKGPPQEEGPPPPAKAAEGKLCLKLEIRPKDRKVAPPQALERTFLALNSPAVRLPPGSLVQVSAMVFIPEPITASPDGA